jgi:hypothetical protein
MLGESVIAGALVGSQGIDGSTSALNPVYWAISAIGVAVYAAMTGGFLVRGLGRRS